MPSTDRIRVLRIVTRLNIGGPAIHVGVLTTGLDPQRFDTRLVIGRIGPQEGDMASRVLPDEARVIRLPSLQRALHPLKDVTAWWRLLRIIQAWRPDVVHTHMAKAGALGRAAAWAVRRLSRGRYRPLVLHTFHGHVLDGYFSPWVAWLFAAAERWLARRTDLLIAVSPSVKEDLVARGIAPAERIAVIPLGLPLEPLLALNGCRQAWRPAGDTGTLTVAWIGRLVPVKCPELFVEALARFGAGYRGRFQGLVVGDGELRPAIEQMVRQRGLAEQVSCVGWVSEMAGLYADADVVCLTSRNEGTPVALIEAMAAGKPVIATAVGGVPDVLGLDRAALQPWPSGDVVRGEGGCVVRPGDAEGLAASLARYAADPDLRRADGEAGRRRVRGRFAAARLIEDMERVYLGQTTNAGVEVPCTH